MTTTITVTTPIVGITRRFYVDATTGSDDDSGLTDALAWETVAKVNAATFWAGDWIVFKRGETWAEMLTPPSSGAAGLPVVFGDYGSGAKPVIDGSALNHSLSIPSAAVHHLSFYNIKFAGATGANRETCRVFTHDFLMDGCEVTGSAAYLGFGAWSETGADIYNLTLTDCLFYGNYKSGLYIGSDDGTAGPHDCLVEDCTAYDNGNNNSADHGFYVCYGTRVNRCTAYNNCAAGFKTNHGVATPPFTYNPIIENCYSYSDANSPPGTAHQWFGIYVGADSSIIRNNHVGPEMKNSNIYLDPGADNCDVFFNTFCNSKSAPSIQVDGGNTGCDIRNNIFCNDTTISGANTLWDENAGALSTFVQNNVIDYNVYYYDGNVATKVFGYADYNWAEWKALTGSPDAHSTMLTALPGFVARYTDLHAAAAGNLLNTGIAIAGLDVDKDGGNRSDTTPTAGCYEDAS